MKIVLPAYQPDKRMLQLINDIKTNSNYDILIVNDGSSENCEPIFERAVEYGCTVLKHTVNLGKGAALKTAFTYLLEQNCTEGIICADCDGQHTWPDIKRLSEVVSEHTASIVLGCREFIGKVPFKSMLGNRITRTVFSILTGNKIADTQTGLRGFSPTMLPWLIKLHGSRYEYEMNQLLEAKNAGFSLHCITIETVYENNNKGSHFHPVSDSIRIYLPILKFSLSSVSCGAIDFILLFVFKLLTGNLLFAVVGARIISSLCNYLVNKHLVFEAKAGQKFPLLLQYYLLAAVILSLNYLLISFFNQSLKLPLLPCKLLTESILFGFSYSIQRKIIFRKVPKGLS